MYNSFEKLKKTGKFLQTVGGINRSVEKKKNHELQKGTKRTHRKKEG
jgi:hypothetical protein